MVGGIPGLLMFIVMLAFLAGESSEKPLSDNFGGTIAFKIIVFFFLIPFIIRF